MRTRVVIYVILVCLLYFPLDGQDSRQESAVESGESIENPAGNLWWVTFGYGYDIPSFVDLAIYLGVSFSPAKVPWLLTTVRTSGFLWGDQDISMLFGILAKEKYAYVSLSAGIGYTYVQYYSWEEGPGGNTVGLTFESQMFLTPFSTFGLGVISFANVNPKRSFIGVALCMQFVKPRR
jgi:hypothetical protein